MMKKKYENPACTIRAIDTNSILAGSGNDYDKNGLINPNSALSKGNRFYSDDKSGSGIWDNN